MQPGKLIVIRDGNNEEEFSLPGGTVSIGRSEVNDIVLGDETASRSHARLEGQETGWVLQDLGSANGTRLNGMRTLKAKLSPGDLITIGNSSLRFECEAPRHEQQITQISSMAELEDTLASETLPVTVTDTREPRLVVHTPGKTSEYRFTKDWVSIGRDPDSGIVLEDPKASRNHARIEQRGRSFVYRDTNSTNGTWLGKQRIEEHVLQDGDVLSIGRARLIYRAGFTPEHLTVVEPPMFGNKLERRPVIMVPGIMGSELWRGSERVWPNLKHVFTHPQDLCLPDPKPTEARALVNEIIVVPNMIKLAKYRRLGNYLEEELGYERGKNLLEFAYDWRQDNRESARRLGQAIENWQKKSKDACKPIVIVAHSMGSLVSRYYVERLGGSSKIDRMIFLGGPHYGAPKVITTLLFGPQLLPFGLLGERLRVLGTTLPALHQLLPEYVCATDQEGRKVDVLGNESWVSERQRPLLRDARAFHRELGTKASVPCISIFGYGLKTITGASIRLAGNGQWKKVEFKIEDGGDATVPETSAVLEGSEIHPVRQYHGSLYTDNDVMMRLKLELTRGLGMHASRS